MCQLLGSGVVASQETVELEYASSASLSASIFSFAS
jgi:hypothetical protein